MEIPSYYLKRPARSSDPKITVSFEKLFSEQVIGANGALVDYKLSAPKWQFLNYLCDTKEVVMHGSGVSTISEFEPRKSTDTEEFGNQSAVYAASDGIWATYFAIVDRDNFVRSLINSCNRVLDEDGEAESYYYFSIDGDALPHQPWRQGTMYILPKETFEPQSTDETGVESTQWRSFESVKPLARIAVGPSDFPFLNQIRGHDFARVLELVAENPDGFPWLEDGED